MDIEKEIKNSDGSIDVLMFNVIKASSDGDNSTYKTWDKLRVWHYSNPNDLEGNPATPTEKHKEIAADLAADY